MKIARGDRPAEPQDKRLLIEKYNKTTKVLRGRRVRLYGNQDI